MLAYAKKAVIAGVLALVAVVLSWNIPAWIDGSSEFHWRSVVAGAVGAFITGIATYYTTNGPPPMGQAK
jgi:hypothetical protein